MDTCRTNVHPKHSVLETDLARAVFQDLNGDGVPEVLQPAETTMTWDGDDLDLCRRLLHGWVPDRELQYVVGGKGSRQVPGIFGVTFWSTTGSQKLSGLAPKVVGAYETTIRGNTYVAGAYPTTYLSVVDVGWPAGFLFWHEIIRGVADDRFTLEDIANSQLRGIVSVPTRGGPVRIGSTIQVQFQSEKAIPKKWADAFDDDFNGLTLTARVLDLAVPFVAQDTSGTFQPLPGWIKVFPVPASWEGGPELDPSFDFRPLFDTGSHYSMWANGVEISATDPREVSLAIYQHELATIIGNDQRAAMTEKLAHLETLARQTGRNVGDVIVAKAEKAIAQEIATYRADLETITGSTDEITLREKLQFLKQLATQTGRTLPDVIRAKAERARQP